MNKKYRSNEKENSPLFINVKNNDSLEDVESIPFPIMFEFE
jgi:hypothetical protein